MVVVVVVTCLLTLFMVDACFQSNCKDFVVALIESNSVLVMSAWRTEGEDSGGSYRDSQSRVCQRYIVGCYESDTRVMTGLDS